MAFLAATFRSSVVQGEEAGGGPTYCRAASSDGAVSVTTAITGRTSFARVRTRTRRSSQCVSRLRLNVFTS